MEVKMVCGHERLSLAVAGIRDWEQGVPGAFSYQKCGACGIYLLNPMPTLEDLKQYYPNDYPAFQIGKKEKGGIYNFLHHLKVSTLRRRLKKFVKSEGAHIYDVGCGSGEMLELFGKWQAARLSGIDFSPIACEIANKKAGIKAECGVFLRADVPGKAYDIVIMHHYIEHTLEPLAELKKAHEILKPGGILILELPNFRSFDQKLFGRFWGGNHCPRHTYQFSDHTLYNYLKFAGFNDVSIKHEINPAHFALSIQNFVEFLKWRAAPRGVANGRAWYFSLLLVLLVPIQVLSVLFRTSGMISVVAKK